jgi:hypothetical protein
MECDSVKKLRDSLIRKYFPEILPLTNQEMTVFGFTGLNRNKFNLFSTFSIMTFNYLIWQMKLRKEIKNFSTIELNWLYALDATFKQSKKIRDSTLQINYSICSRWRRGDG